MPIWLMIALQTLQTVPPPATFDLPAPPAAKDLSITRRCGEDDGSGDVVVCGGRRGQYRLPLPVERDASEDAGGDAQSGAAALAPSTPCGIFTGERLCSKKEAARYGYGAGRNPLTVLGRVAGRLADPDGN